MDDTNLLRDKWCKAAAVFPPEDSYCSHCGTRGISRYVIECGPWISQVSICEACWDGNSGDKLRKNMAEFNEILFRYKLAELMSKYWGSRQGIIIRKDEESKLKENEEN